MHSVPLEFQLARYRNYPLVWNLLSQDRFQKSCIREGRELVASLCSWLLLRHWILFMPTKTCFLTALELFVSISMGCRYRSERRQGRWCRMPRQRFQAQQFSFPWISTNISEFLVRPFSQRTMKLWQWSCLCSLTSTQNSSQRSWCSRKCPLAVVEPDRLSMHSSNYWRLWLS